MTCLAAIAATRNFVAGADVCADEDEEPIVPTCSTDRILRVVRGTHVTVRITVYDADDARVDLTGYAMSFRVARELAGAVEFTKTVGVGITLLTQSGDTLGQAEVALVPADTAALEVGVHRYEVRTTSPTPASEIQSVIPPAEFVVVQEL